MLIATFDDDQEELIEIFDTGFFTFFCALIFFLVFKYSQHYFAFLDDSCLSFSTLRVRAPESVELLALIVTTRDEY